MGRASGKRPGSAAARAFSRRVGRVPVAAAAFVSAAALAATALGEETATVSPAAPTAASPPSPDIAPLRPFRFRVAYGLGYFRPADVNGYINSIANSDPSVAREDSDMKLLLSGELSVAYYPIRYFGIRPTIAYHFSPQVVTVGYGTARGFWLHSISRGLAFELAYDQGGLARFFASPGVSYDVGWFEGYSASGLGLSLALGTDLSFGQAHAKGVYLAVLLRRAKLGIGRRPNTPGEVTMNNLDFTSLIFCLGFQMGI
jgi:hypothetical protein